MSDADVTIVGDVETAGLGVTCGAMLFTIAPGATSDPHRHQSEESWIVRRGICRAVVDGVPADLAAGDRFTVPADTLHSLANLSPVEELEIVGFWWRES